MKYFVSSDIHGFFDQWMYALNNAGFNKHNPDHKIILCGDMFDRGHQPKQIIDFINDMGDKIILIKGNHEDLMEDLIAREYAHSYDVSNGTVETLYDLSPSMYANNVSLKIIAENTGLTGIINKCYNYYETDNYIFVHGYIPVNHMDDKNYTYKKNWRNANPDEWKNARWVSCVDMYKKKIHEPKKKIVCGHWHCSALWAYKYPKQYMEFDTTLSVGNNNHIYKANFDIFHSNNIIAIDACTAYSNKVNVLVVEDTIGGK